MLTLKDYVNWGLTHCDKIENAESVQDATPSPENSVEVESVGEHAGIKMKKIRRDIYVL